MSEVESTPLLYSQDYQISVGTPDNPFYYFFDYDQRAAPFHMDFQHFHNFCEIHILLDGDALYMIEGEYFSIKPFDVVIVRPHLLHKTEYAPGSPRKRLVIYFKLGTNLSHQVGEAELFFTSFDQLQTSLGTNMIGNSDYFFQSDYDQIFQLFFQSVPIFRFPSALWEKLFLPLNEIFQLGKDPSKGFNLGIHSYFSTFLCNLFQLQSHNIYVSAPLDKNQNLIQNITEFINKQYFTHLTLQSLAKEFFISTAHLSRQFKKDTGYNLIHYIQLVRIKNAQQYLQYTKMKITEIATRCGFFSFSQFNRVFHQYTDMSPTDYRRKSVGYHSKQGIISKA